MADRTIMVVPKQTLFFTNYFQGFKPADWFDFESKILANYKWMLKDDAEKDPGCKQPIGYAIIVNPRLKRVFAYQRASQDSRYEEKRLHGKWSWGVGGHIERWDALPAEKDTINLITKSLKRELEEEVNGLDSAALRVLGFINDDSTPVSKVHFGILYLVETNSITIKPNNAEIDHGELKTLEELEAILQSPDFQVEDWSRIAIGPLKEYFSKRK